jgi:hypothetical protein
MDSSSFERVRSRAFSIFSLLLLCGPASAATTWWVANDGIDGPGCGAKASACRSISQAIENASDGDTIEVGAGLYGDLKGDGSFSAAGSEHPQQGVRKIPGCVICIDKAVAIRSIHGAAVTVIQAPPGTAYPVTVLIVHDGVNFGLAAQGFTVRGGNDTGVEFDQDSNDSVFGIRYKQNVVVAGNIDQGDGTGFKFQGLEFEDHSGGPCPVPDCIPTAQFRFSDNQSFGNAAIGFSIFINAYGGGPIAVQRNLAQGAGSGFVVEPGFQDETGDSFSAGQVSLTNNVATGGQYGFVANAAGQIVANTAIGNSVAGFELTPGGAAFAGNSALGNGGPGVIVQFSRDLGDLGPYPSFSTFGQNNFYGNDRNRPPLSFPGSGIGGDYDAGPGAHCGVLNLGSLAAKIGPEPVTPVPTEKLTATGNFWGSSAGPKSSGGGDMAGGACDQNGGVTIVKPFATADFAITTLP